MSRGSFLSQALALGLIGLLCVWVAHETVKAVDRATVQAEALAEQARCGNTIARMNGTCEAGPR